jgi:prepilin signal peptidase PulO-like enzyme (type II secretory pathway)
MNYMTSLNNIITDLPVFSFFYFLFLGAEIASFLGFCVFRYTIWLNSEYEKAINEATNTNSDVKQVRTIFDSRSSCDSCRTKIPIWYNLPILGYLILKGKTKCCNVTLTREHLFKETYLGLMTAFYVLYIPISYESIILYLLIPITFLLAEIDRKNKILPDSLIFISGIIYILHEVFLGRDVTYSLMLYLVGMVIINIAYFKDSINEKLGKGDANYLLLLLFISNYSISFLYALIVISISAGITKALFNKDKDIKLGWPLHFGFIVILLCKLN